jgi:PilZ domain
MPLDHTLDGRMEKRLPIVVVVRLAQAEPACPENEERTFTDNVSSGGARVFSTRPWQPGDAIRVTPRQEDSASGSVVYCQKLDDGRFVIGVEFQERPVTWSVLLRYDGSQSGVTAKAKSS